MMFSVLCLFLIIVSKVCLGRSFGIFDSDMGVNVVVLMNMGR